MRPPSSSLRITGKAGWGLGEHNRALLAELGVDDAGYAQLLAAGISCEGEPVPAAGADG